MKKIAVTGIATCAFSEAQTCFYRLAGQIMAAGPELVCAMRDAVDTTKLSDLCGLPIEYVFGDDEDTLAEALSACDCVIVFWDGKDSLSAKTANLAKRKGKQLRVHTIQEAKDAPPKRSIGSLLTKSRPKESDDQTGR